MRSRLRWGALTAVAAMGVLAVGACGSSSGGTSASPSAATLSPTPGASVDVGIATADLGGQPTKVLVDRGGLTLYYNAHDTATAVTCTGACATSWPPLVLASGAPTGSAALPGALDVLVGANGRQVTYNRHPLYRFQADGGPGHASGQRDFAAGWFAATPGLAPI